jgi:sulfur-carrier protein adenylyltransferase/sulfurtransferase
MWWAKDPERLKGEVAAIDELREREAWLAAATPRLAQGLKLAFDLDILVNGEMLPFTLEYPDFFPETPPLVFPRDERHLSGHQYGDGGELCLEYRVDNWDPSVTGAMMIASAHRLIDGERASAEPQPSLPSAHHVSIGQQLRGSHFRFLVTESFLTHVASLPTASCHDAAVISASAPDKTWVAHVAFVGPADQPVWREPAVPNRFGREVPAILVRVDSIAGLSPTPTHDGLARVIVDAGGAAPEQPDLGRFIVLADRTGVQAFISFSDDGRRIVIPYRAVDLSQDGANRLPPDYAVLAQKKVGIVGCGSLGSKIAAHLARSGARDFVLVDDDIFRPCNLVRNELNADAVGVHKTDALEARLASLAPDAKVRCRRVALGGQESAGTTSSVLDELAACDVLVDATAAPQAFNFVSAVACAALRPMVWAEVYAGGIGGFVARLRPNIEPPPLAARQQYLAWCHSQGVPWHGDDHEYGARQSEGPPLVADDAEVALIAAQAARMAIDALLRGEATIFPHPAYVIGLSANWIFREPFDTRPIDFVGGETWATASLPERTAEAVQFMTSLFERIEHESRTGT